MFYSPFKIDFNDLQPNQDFYVVILGIGELYKILHNLEIINFRLFAWYC